MFEREVDRHPASHRRADNNRRRQPEVEEQSGEIGGVPVLTVAVHSPTEATQVGSHHAPFTCESVRLGLPHAGISNPGVDQNEWVSLTIINESQPCHYADVLP